MASPGSPAEPRITGQRRARRAGLVYVNGFDQWITRRRCGRGFRYFTATGRMLAESKRRRIEALAIPPAWQSVLICPQPNGHIQVVGLDDAGRRQYIYHPQWESIRESTKYDRLQLFADRLPTIRRRVRRDLAGRKLTKHRVLAAVVRLLDKAHIRVGNERYLSRHGSRGATTLTDEHIEVQGVSISLDFPGKSGKRQQIELVDAKAAKVIRQCEEIEGQYLFSFQDAEGKIQSITSGDVNHYLQEISGQTITAKDFRTWWGSVIALREISAAEYDPTPTACKRAIAAAVKATAAELGNTAAVCRGSYIHPGILRAAESEKLEKLLLKIDALGKARPELSAAENRFLNLLPQLELTTGETQALAANALLKR